MIFGEQPNTPEVVGMALVAGALLVLSVHAMRPAISLPNSGA
jgi:hypothetical protein